QNQPVALRIRAASSAAPGRLGPNGLQQGIAIDEMGFRAKLRGSNPGPLMSALGQKQTFKRPRLMSALPQKRTLVERIKWSEFAILGPRREEIRHCDPIQDAFWRL